MRNAERIPLAVPTVPGNRMSYGPRSEAILSLRTRRGLLRRASPCHYRGHLSIKLFNRAYWEAPLDEVVERCYRGLAGLLAMA
jgi:hypothetical protein